MQASTSTDQAAVARFRAALAAKDEVEAHLESELAAARAQAASYEHRQASSLCHDPHCPAYCRSFTETRAGKFSSSAF